MTPIDVDCDLTKVPQCFIFPTLYKKDSKGKMRQYKIYFDGKIISTVTGQVDGKQTTHRIDVKLNKSGKDIYQQAYTEARSRFVNKTDEGYCRVCDENMVNYGLMKGPHIKPDDDILFPVIATPKLNGIRCQAYKQDGRVCLYSYSGVEIKYMNHIRKELESIIGDEILDGELYSHTLTFESIQGICNRTINRHSKETHIRYCVFDTVWHETPYEDRYNYLVDLIGDSTYVKHVKAELITNKEDLYSLYDDYLRYGFEGLMIRYTGFDMEGYERPLKELRLSYYKPGKVVNLRKIKPMYDAEAVILDCGECSGDAKGAPVFKLEYTGDYKGEPCNIIFEARMKGKMGEQRDTFLNVDSLIGATIRFQYLSRTNGGNFRDPVVISLERRGKAEY